MLQIKDTSRTEKLPLTHFERFARMCKATFNMNVPEDLYPLEELDSSGSVVSDTTLDAYLSNRIPLLKSLMDHSNPTMRSEYYALRACFAHALAFGRHKRLFMVEKGLTQRLINTTIDKVDAQYVRSPFKSIYLSIPHNEELLIPNVMTGEHKVRGCYVYSEVVDATKIHTRDLSGAPILASTRFGCDTLHFLKILAVGEAKDTADLPGSGEDDALFYGMFFLKDGSDIKAQIHEQCTGHCQNASEIPYLEALMGFLVNCLLYMSSPDAAMERVGAKYTTVDKRASTKDKARADEKNRSVSKIGAISIGAGISVMPSMDGYYADTPLAQRVIGCPIWMVRGHWRAQPYGPGRTLRRPQWIEPYDKGKGLGASVLSGRDYIVQEAS
jgi:hypothetical protein